MTPEQKKITWKEVEYAVNSTLEYMQQIGGIPTHQEFFNEFQEALAAELKVVDAEGQKLALLNNLKERLSGVYPEYFEEILDDEINEIQNPYEL